MALEQCEVSDDSRLKILWSRPGAWTSPGHCNYESSLYICRPIAGGLVGRWSYWTLPPDCLHFLLASGLFNTLHERILSGKQDNGTRKAIRAKLYQDSAAANMAIDA